MPDQDKTKDYKKDSNLSSQKNLDKNQEQRSNEDQENWKKQIKEHQKESLLLADEIIHASYWHEASNLQKNIILSCLKTDYRLYSRYANTIKLHPEYKKYLQIYNYKWKSFLIVPTFEPNENTLTIRTTEIRKNNENMEVVSEYFYTPEHPYTKSSNVIPVSIEDKSQEYWYHRISMNKWTGEISDIEPSKYIQDEKWIKWLINTIEEKSKTRLETCSKWLESSITDIFSKEDELKKESHEFSDQKIKLAQNLMQWDFTWAINSFIDIIKSFFKRKKNWRVIDLWKWLNYEWDEKDINYLKSAIETVLDPEQRSKLTYLLSKIKDKKTKEWLKENWLENPSQFDLLLQQLQPWWIMLTNALDLEGKSSAFKFATQAIAWWRWCHALIISDVIKNSNWIVTDAKIIQSTLKWWVHETTLKKYIKENYSASDFLLANIPENKRTDMINNAKSKIWQKYDRVSIVTDSLLWFDVDKWFSAEDWDFISTSKAKLLWNNKSYCSELVFDAIDKSGLKMPQPHMSPSDLLMTDEITPQYACYCNKL